MIYFTSDTHFADPRVLRIDRRPFRNMAEHDAALVESWNAVVGTEDEIWHLGDVMSERAGNCDDLLTRLNGRKHLIVGNNDPVSTTAASGWASVQHYAEILLDGHLLILCHYPFRTWNKMGRKSINLHGHSHGRLKPQPRQFDVGVDARDLRPVTLERLLLKPPRRREPKDAPGVVAATEREL
jgi:calcineurin-like phosphoesterase family protein